MNKTLPWKKQISASGAIPDIDGYYVYLLLCADNSLYCGWTTNLIRRYKAHASGKGAKYTRAHHPVLLYYYESCESKSAACQREAQIKRMSHLEKIALKER